MDVKHTVKEAAEKGAELWAAKKGLEMTGSLLKMACVAGAGYLGYRYYRKNQRSINRTIKNTIS